MAVNAYYNNETALKMFKIGCVMYETIHC